MDAADHPVPGLAPEPEPGPEPTGNRRAFLACMAKDRDTAAEALEAIDKPDLDPWGGGSDGQRNYQACRRWALQS